jgi:hypothetical protein
MEKKTTKKSIVKKKPTIKKKNYLDIVLEDKEGRTESVIYGGGLNDEYLINYISEKVSKLKLGQKLLIKPMEILSNN